MSCTHQKKKAEIERVINVFHDYIEQATFLDILWTDKAGYVFLYIDGIDVLAVDSTYIESAEMLFSRPISEIESDVLVSTGNEHTMAEADYLEKREMQRRFKPYLEQFPEYRHLAEI